MALVKEAVVEGQARLVGGVVVAVGENPGPGDGQPVALEAHLGKQLDVLLVVVVHVDGLMGGVAVAVIAVQHLHLAQHHREPVGAEGDHIHRGQTPASLLVGTFTLVGGGGAAPQEIGRQ